MPWCANIGSRLYLQALIFLHLLTILKDIWTSIFRFHEAKNYGPIMAATNLFGNIINIHPFEDGNGKNLPLDFGSCCVTDKVLSISSNFKLLSYAWQKRLHMGSKKCLIESLQFFNSIIKMNLELFTKYLQEKLKRFLVNKISLCLKGLI